MFNKVFKFYKTKTEEPCLEDVLDFDDPHGFDVTRIEFEIGSNQLILPPGVKPVSEWMCYKLNSRPGLIFIRNPFTGKGQRYWISRSLRDYTKAPNVVNLSKKTFSQEVIDDWWKEMQKVRDNTRRKNIKRSMRWSTLGYHHDWDSKIYSEEMKSVFPSDLKNVTRFFADVMNFENYSPEAAIVNFYPIGTTLSGHTDHSENDLEAPLFSFSFGQTAIFLIGGHTKEEKPSAIFLKSGDIVIMSKESRLCYHAVPRIMKTTAEPWNVIDEYDKRLSKNDSQDPKRIKYSDSNVKCYYEMDMDLWNNCCDNNVWLDFNDYLADSRINFNVRQVLKNGETTL